MQPTAADRPPARPGASVLADTPERFGLVSRFLHWLVALLVVWQFAGLALWRVFGDVAWVRFATALGPNHGTVGLAVLVLTLARAAWLTRERSRRPSRGRGPRAVAEKAVHAAFYVLLLLVPALALLRTYGGGEGWRQWGVTIVPETGREIGWMTAPADLLHGPLAWMLAVLAAGHVAMAILHHLRGSPVIRRMAGPF